MEENTIEPQPNCSQGAHKDTTESKKLHPLNQILFTLGNLVIKTKEYVRRFLHWFLTEVKFGRWIFDTVLIRNINNWALQPKKAVKFKSLWTPKPDTSTIPYITWRTLTNKVFNGRNLDPKLTADSTEEKDLEKLAHLFMRKKCDDGEENMIYAERTSVLFPFFARWFTDSFMRIDGKDRRKNSSNHEIDLCQIYGLNENDTNTLRTGTDGKLKTNAKGLYPAKLFRPLADGENLSSDILETVVIKRQLDCTPTTQPGKTAPSIDSNTLSCGDPDCHCPPPSEKTLYEFEGFTVKEEFRALIDSQRNYLDRCSLQCYLKLLFGFNHGQAKTPVERVEDMYATGLERGNASVGYTMFSTLFLRNHNRLAEQLKNSGLSDDDHIFQTARMINIIHLLKIVVLDYVNHAGGNNLGGGFYPDRLSKNRKLPNWLNIKQQWFRKNWVTIEFNLLYRWHSLIPENFFLNGNNTLEVLFQNNELLEESGLEKLFKASSEQSAGKLTLNNTPNYLFRAEKNSLKLDRRFKLKPYIDYRSAYGLPPVGNLNELCGNELAQDIATAYGTTVRDFDMSKLDLYVGLFAESVKPSFLGWLTGQKPIFGKLLYNMVAGDAFSHVYGNPLCSPEILNEEVLTSVGMQEIDEVNSIEDLLKKVLNNNQVSASFDRIG